MVDQQIQNPNQDSTILQWDFPEFAKHSRGVGWYITASIVAGGLIVWAAFSQNYLFIILILLACIILLRQGVHEPRRIRIALTADGISISTGKTYLYDALSHFWIIYKPPETKSLFFTFKSGLRPDLIIPLEDQNPIKIREVLSQFLPENLDREHEPVAESLGRALKM